MKTHTVLLGLLALPWLALSTPAQSFWNRGLESISFAAPDSSIVIVQANWWVEAADAASYDLGTDVEFYLNGALLDIQPTTATIMPSGSCIGSAPPCDNSFCGDWIVNGSAKSGNCRTTQVDPAAGYVCVCRRTLTTSVLLNPDPVQGDVFEVRLVPRAGALVDTYACDDSLTTIFSAVCNTSDYCSGKPNSCASLPRISSTGIPSATASCGYLLRGSRARRNKTGILLYTDRGSAAVPFQGGTLCVQPTGLRRSVPVTSWGGSSGSACDAEFVLDWNAFAAGSLGGNPAGYTRVFGTRVNVQWWGRDTQANGSYLSDALQFFVCL